MNPSKTDLDPRILGQLLAAQSVSSLLSSRLKMGEFVCRVVEGLPGVASCAVCLPGAERPRLGGEPTPECADCDVPEGDVDHDPGQPCLLTSHVSIQIFPLKTQDRHFGFLLLKLEERERYAPYEPFVSNLADGLAVNIDRQWQKEGLEAANVELRRHREHLEVLVRDRTAGLEAANEELRISEEELASQLEELQQSRDALRLKNFVFDASISANSIVDMNGVITEANAAFLKVWGYTSKEEVVGRPIPDFLQDQDEVAAILAALSTTGEWEGDYTAKRKDGTTFAAHGLASAVRDEGGKVIGYQSAVLDITERKRMEKQLAESELRYRALFDRAPYGVLLIDLETTRAVDFNEPTARQLGYSRAEFAKLRITDYETIETAAETAKHIEKILTEGIDTFETRHRTKNGEIRNVLVSAQRLKLSGRIYVACVFQDITERKRAEEALCQSEEKYRTLSEFTWDWVYWLDNDYRFVYCSPSCERITGYAAEEFVNDPSLLIGIVHPEDRALMIEHRKAYHSSAEHGELEFRIVRRNGEVRWIEHVCKPIVSAEGSRLGRRSGNRDITERQRAEEALKESKEIFSKVFHASPVGLSITRLADGQYIDVNEAFLSLFGYTREEALSHTSFQLQTWASPEERDRVVKILREQARVQNIETQYRRKSGEIWTALVSAEVIEVAGERYALGLLQDITERKQAAEALRRSAVDLARSNKDLEQFAYVASHDLQEPLRMVASFTQLLEKRYKGKLDAEADEFIKYVVDGANRMQQLINDLLTYSRLGTRGRSFELCDSQSVLGQVIVNLRTAIAENQALITNDGLPTIMADETQMIQLFQNLIGNAIKFRRKESPLIHVSAQRKDNEWVFLVRDNGIGIDPQYRERIFTIFQRLHAKEEYKGTGIGLAICQRIIERHGGRIWVDSEPGKGSTFCFTMPQRLPATLEK